MQFDPVTDHILADVQTRTDIAVIDPKTDRIIKRVRVPNCVSDHAC